MHIQSLIKNIRFWVLAVGIACSAVIFLGVISVVPKGLTQIVRLQQLYAFASMMLLYFTLLAGPFCYTFRTFAYRGQYLKARRALGVMSFYFAVLHVLLAFFGQLGGFAGLGFLSNTYLLAVVLGFTALFIMFFLAVTSFDFIVVKMTFQKWKLLHRLVYLAGIATLVHTVMLGTHFSNLSGNISEITFIALAFLLLLEAPRFDTYLTKIIPAQQFSMSFVLTVVGLSAIFFTLYNPISNSGGTISFDIHAAHKQLALEAQQNSSGNNTPGLQGDKTRRYTVSFIPPNSVEPNTDTILEFKVNDAASGNPVSFFNLIYTKIVHLIVVDSTLTYFNHIHPDQKDNSFIMTAQFPKSGLYHLYINFQPVGGIEQQFAFVLPVGIGKNEKVELSKQPPDTKLTKAFGDYEVTVSTQGVLSAQVMSLGKQRISFSIKDAKTKKGIDNLKPYLGAFGHLTMINEETFDYIHVHPFNLRPPLPNANGGPTVDFLPIGIYGPFKPGVYRVFAEFNPDNTLFLSDFTVRIQ